MNKRKKGDHFETMAQEWLKQKGLKTISRNYHCRYGEIDLIMLDQQACLCFIEVKFRAGSDFGGSAYSLPASKQRKLTRTALHYLDNNRQYQQNAKRFDALLLQGDDHEKPSINWIRNAFYAE